jgi:hypothetical protein
MVCVFFLRALRVLRANSFGLGKMNSICSSIGRHCQVLLLTWVTLVQAGYAEENSLPSVSIVWPHAGARWSECFSGDTFVKIKADATDPDGFISQVRFYAGTYLIGVVTNPPFNVIWLASPAMENSELKAVAVDNLGATSESAPVSVFVSSGGPTMPVVEIISPRDGTFIAMPSEFTFSAEVLASYWDNGPIEFFVDTNSVGIVNQGGSLNATSPPASITITGLAEGTHDLFVRYLGSGGFLCASCYFVTNHVRVVRLAAQLLPQNPGEPFRFEVVTSYTNRPNIVERSVDWQRWSPVSTNIPTANRFTFSDQDEPQGLQRFYRVLVPAE